MIDFQRDKTKVVVTLSRGPVNGLNASWLRRFNEVLNEIEAVQATTVIVRSDQRVFCAGADLRYFSERFESEAGRRELVAFVTELQAALARLEALPCVTLAEIGGPAMGGGLELALACDFRLLSDSALIGLPEVGIGLIPGAGGTQRLTRIAGSGAARRMILSGRPVDAEAALRTGIADWIVADAQLRDESLRIVSRFELLSAEAIAAAKVCLRAALDPRANGFAEELTATAKLLDSGSTQQRIRAFLAGVRMTGESGR